MKISVPVSANVSEICDIGSIVIVEYMIIGIGESFGIDAAL